MENSIKDILGYGLGLLDEIKTYNFQEKENKKTKNKGIYITKNEEDYINSNISMYLNSEEIRNKSIEVLKIEDYLKKLDTKNYNLTEQEDNSELMKRLSLGYDTVNSLDDKFGELYDKTNNLLREGKTPKKDLIYICSANGKMSGFISRFQPKEKTELSKYLIIPENIFLINLNKNNCLELKNFAQA